MLKLPIRRFIANAGWNVLGQVVPLLVAIVVLPHLIRTMGMERYGFLTLVWVLVGYAGLFDFGIGRALTRTVAHRLANQDLDGATHISIVGLTYMLLFGLAVGGAFALLTPWLAHTAFSIPEVMHDEAITALLLLATSIPVVMLSAGYSAVLSAHQKFGSMNILRASLGVATYIGPLIVVQYENRLDYVVGFIVVMRFVTNSAYAMICRKQCQVRFIPLKPDRASSRELFLLGGWITVSNVISPFLTYLDRLVLGGLVTIQAVAYYSTPYDIITKSLIVPYSIMGVIFPIASGLSGNKNEAMPLFTGSVRALFVLMFPMMLAFFVLAHPVLQLWLGIDFALNGAPVLRWLAVGLLFNALAQVPATIIQATGKPKWMAIVHIIELPIFVALLWVLTNKLGIVGTAIAAAVRYGADMVVLYALAVKGIIGARIRVSQVLVPACLGGVLFSGALLVPSTLGISLLYLGAALAVFAVYAWHYLLQPSERLAVTSRLGDSNGAVA